MTTQLQQPPELLGMPPSHEADRLAELHFRQSAARKVVCELFTQLPTETHQAMEAMLEYVDARMEYLMGRLGMEE